MKTYFPPEIQIFPIDTVLGKVWFLKMLFKTAFPPPELLGLGGWNAVEGFVCADGIRAPWL